MDLAKLNFQVETSKLLEAVNLVAKLGDAVQELGKDVQSLAVADKNASAAALLQAKARRENALAAKAEASATQGTVKAKKAATEAVEASTRASSAAEKALERQLAKEEILTRGTITLGTEMINLGRGFTSSQAAALGMLKSIGATKEQIDAFVQSLKNTNTVLGPNPFDKTIGGLSKLDRQLLEIRTSQNLAAKGFAVTADQAQLLSRDLQALVGAYRVARQAGREVTDEYINRAIDVTTRRFARKALVVNELTANMKENERQAKKAARSQIDAGLATNYVTNELARAENALQGLNNDLHISTSNRLLKFEQQLKSSGMAISQQTVLLEKYRDTLTRTDKLRSQKGHLPGRSEEDRRVDLLSRSLAPQISDVIVSLQGGMNPFTVLMQQGMQVRDLMQLSGVEAGRMGDAFRKAGQGMVTTTVAAASAIGNMLLGVVIDTGKAITDFGIRTTNTREKIDDLRYSLWWMTKSSKESTVLLGKIGQGMLAAIPAAVGTIIAAATAAFIGLAVGLVQVIKEENNLAKVLALNAGNLNMSHTAAIEYAKSFDAVSTSTSKVIDVLAAMAKTGAFSRNEFDMVVTSALEMQKYADVAIDDTVKSFEKMKDEPVKALLELARTTGMVPAAVQEAVIELEREGKVSEASALAFKTSVDVKAQQIQRMKEDFNDFSLFMKELGASIATFFSNAFKDLWRKADPIEQMKKQVAAARSFTGSRGVGGFWGSNKEVIENMEEQIRLANKSISAQQSRSDEIVKTAKLNELFLKNENFYLDQKAKRQQEVAKAERENLQLLKAGIITQEQAANRIKEIEEKYKDKRQPQVKKTPQQRADDSVYNKAQKDLEKLRDAALKAEAAAMNYSDVQKAALDVFDDPAFYGYYDKVKKARVGYTEQQRIAFAREFEMLEARRIANEEARKAAEESQKAIAKAAESSKQAAKEAFDQEVAAWDEFEKNLEQSKQSLKLLQEESEELKFQSGIMHLVSDQRALAIEQRKIELEYAKKISEIDKLPSSPFTDKQQLKDLALEEKEQKLKNLNQKIANDLNQQLIDGVTDAIMKGLVEGGQAGKKALRDLIVAELQKPIRIFVQAVVGSITGSSSAQGIVGSVAQSALGSTVAGSTVAAIGSSVGTGFMTGVTGQSVAAASTAYAAAGMKGVAVGLEMGAMLANPYVLAAAAVVAGWDKLFGRKVSGQGIQANIAGGQVQGVNQYTSSKGGIFRSDKTSTSVIDSGTANKVAKDIEAVKFQALGMANALGLNASAIDGFNGKLEVNYKGAKTAEEQTQRYSEGMDKLYASMLKSAGGVEKFQMAGESAEAAIKRMTKEALDLGQKAGYSADSVTDTLVKAMTGRMEEADVGAALGDIIVGSVYNALAMGFAEQITSSITGLIIQPIMTSILAGGSITAAVSQASIDAVVQQAQSAINAFNQVISDPAFQAMISQLNSMTMEIVGMSIAPVQHIQSFGSAMRSAADDAAEAANRIAEEKFGLESDLMQLLGMTTRLRERELAALDGSNRSLKQQIHALEDAKTKYDAVRDASEDTLSNLEETRDTIRSIFDLLKDNVRELRDEVSSTASLSASEARNLLSTAISTGVLPDQDKIELAISSLKNQLDSQAFESQVAEDRARILLSNDLETLANISDKQLTEQEWQITLLENTLRNAEGQLNALLGIETYSFNTQQAVEALNASMLSYIAEFNKGIQSVVDATVVAQTTPTGGGGGGGGGFSFGGYEEPARSWTAQGYASKNPDLVAEYNNNSGRRGWPSELSSMDKYLEWHWANYGQKENRQFARGGAFTNGIVTRPTMFNIGEMGEAGSEAIMPLSNVGGSLGVRATVPDMQGVIDELIHLRQEVNLMRHETRAIATNTKKSFDILDDVTQGGTEVRVNVTNTPSVEVI